MACWVGEQLSGETGSKPPGAWDFTSAPRAGRETKWGKKRNI